MSGASDKTAPRRAGKLVAATRRTCGSAAIVLLSAGCPPALAQPYPVTTSTDIAYGPLPDEKLDLCFPKGLEGARPVVVIVHGGGWHSGDKRTGGFFCALAAQHGLVGASINYRLFAKVGNVNQWPAQLVDTQLAVRWLRAHAEQFHLDPKRFCAVGGSAGGHLATFLGVLKQIEPGDQAGMYPSFSPAVSCVVNEFGPVDFTTVQGLKTAVEDLVPVPPGKTQHDALTAASPLFRIGRDSAPMLIIYGTHDTLVEPQQLLELQAALKRNGVPVEMDPYDGNHNFHDITKEQRADLLLHAIEYIVSIIGK